MKANVLYGVRDLRYTDYPLPALQPGEVLVRVKACGICGSDVGRVLNTGTYHFPTIIGHEFAGVVVDAEGKETTRVGVFPLKPCMQCTDCLRKKYELCTDYDYLGSRCDGGFAEYVAVPEWNLLPLPDNVTFEQAAMLEPSAVALHALRRFSETKGKTLVIYGPGTIGNMLVMLSKSMGIKTVIAVGRNKTKLDIAKSNGADFTADMASEDTVTRILELTDGVGADLCIEGTGDDKCLEQAILCLRGEGELLLMGNPHGDIELKKAVYWKILRRQLVLHGTWNSSFHTDRDDWTSVLAMTADGRYHPESLITHRLPLTDLSEGIRYMADPAILTNKVMIHND